MRRRRGAGIGALVLAGIAVLAATVTGGAGATDGCQTFPQTGHQVCGAFLAYWQANGGLAQQGYPISEPMQETSATDGVTRTVQYFERAEFESHPDLPNTPVLLTLLGSQAYRARYGATATAGSAPTPPVSGASATPTGAPAMTGVAGGGTRWAQGDTAVTLWGARVNAPDAPGHGEHATDGHVCRSYDVTVANRGEAQFSYNALGFFILQLADGAVAMTYPCSSIAPQGASNILMPGAEDRMWINFDVPKDATATALVYDDQRGHHFRFTL